MYQDRKNITSRAIAVVLIIFLANPALYGAEVYYLGQAQSLAPGQTVSNPSYSLSQRFRDLFDFASYGSRKDRSGRISGSFMQEIDWNKVSGNRSKSFLENGTEYVTELNCNIQEKLWEDYNFEGQIFARKTDNYRIEPRKDVRIKQLTLKVQNPRNLFQLGDFYDDFSQFVLGNSLEGFDFQVSPSSTQKYKFVAARTTSFDVASEKFQRNVFGGKIDRYLFPDSKLFSNFRVGIQAVTSQDDSSAPDRTSNTKDLRNYVGGIDGEVTFTKVLSLAYEWAYSSYLEDEDSPTIKDTQYGNAVRFQPVLSLGRSHLRYLYYYVQPKFYSEVGSASPDKMQHQLTYDYRFSEKMSLSLTENYYWDHLKGSTLTKRTINDEKYLTFNIRPFTARRDFTLRPYINYLKKNSDDPANSAESATRTIGFSIFDTLGPKTTYGLTYEYRSFTDEATRSTSDYFNRLSLNIAHEQQFCHRRLYYSFEPSADLRRTKVDDDKDVNVTVSFNGQYDVSKILSMRCGYNVQNTNSARPDSDFINHRSFLEFDFRVSEKRATHLIIRAERNHYNHQDGSQDYNETRAIAKFVTNF